MRQRPSSFLSCVCLLLILLSFCPLVSAASDSESKPKITDKPCTVHSPTSGSFFDLRPISLSPPNIKDGQPIGKDDRTESWHAKGFDYNTNFTINICAPVIEPIEDVVGVGKARWESVSAYYELDGKIYSLGEQASQPFFRGRKLVLNYTNGSPCPSDSKYSPSLREHFNDGQYDEYEVYAAEENDHYQQASRTKSTIMSFLCDRDSPTSQAAISFVGTIDSCTYFFEVRSAAACGGVASASEGGLGPAGVFGVIAAIAIVVYLVGGCAYQRTVMHQRGWRQCPNYSMWEGIIDLMKDFTIILFSFTRCIKGSRPSSSGYSRVNGSHASRRRGGIISAIGGRGRGESRGDHLDVDEENRLIDQLDEGWDDEIIGQ